MMLILERIERYCASPTYIVDLPAELEDACHNELELWKVCHARRLTELRRKDPAQGLNLVAELYAQATNGPPEYRSDMCTNVLLEIMGFVCRDEASRASRELLETTVLRVDALESTALNGVARAAKSFRPQRAVGYAGSARAHAGLLLDRRLLVETGMKGMLDAAATPHEWSVDFLWANALGFVEKLLEEGYEGAGDWACKAADIARRDTSFGLRHTAAIRVVPRLEKVWDKRYPGLMNRLRLEAERDA